MGNLAKLSRWGLTLFLAVLSGCCHELSKPPYAAGPGEQSLVTEGVQKMKLVAHGAGKGLSYKAPQYGRLYLYDSNTGQFIYKGYLAAAEQFDFEPASSRAEINRQHVDLERGTNDRDEYELYFAPM